MSASLDDMRRRIADAEQRRETAEDEQTARAAADEVHGLMDAIENVRELARLTDDDA